MTATPSPLISSRTKPLLDFVRKQAENRRFSQTLEIVFSIFFVIFFLVFAIRPTAFTISALIGEIKSKEILSKQMQKKINQVIEAQNSYAEFQAIYPTVNSSLPDDYRFSQAANQIRSAFQPSGDINTLDFSLPEPKTTPENQYRVDIKRQSDFNSAVTFITRILAGRRLMAISSISFSAIDQKSQASTTVQPSGVVNTDFSIDVLYWNETPKNDQK